MELLGRMDLEAEVARRLSRVSSRHRKELIELLGTPPDPANIPPEFWAKVEKEEREEMLSLLLLLFVTAGEQHIDALLPADLRAAALGVDDSGMAVGLRDAATRWADKRATDFAAFYVDRSRARINMLPREWYGHDFQIRRLAGELKPPGQERVLRDVLDVFGPDRDANIAATETTRAQTAGTHGAQGRAADLGYDVSVVWRTERDGRVCSICYPLHGASMDEWDRIVTDPRALAEIIANGGPPAHPACRCFLDVQSKRREVRESIREASACGAGDEGSPGFETGNTCAGEGGGGSDDPHPGTRRVKNDPVDIGKYSREIETKASPAEVDAIKKYTSGSGKGLNAEQINESLRSGGTIDDPVTAKTVEKLSAAIEKHGVKGLEVYRGISVPLSERAALLKQFVAALDNGTEVTMNGFSSCSHDPNVAAEFALRYSDNRPMVMKITTDRGLPVEGLSGFEDEREVLLNHKSRFRVREVYKGYKVGREEFPYVVHLEELPVRKSGLSESVSFSRGDQAANRFVAPLSAFEFEPPPIDARVVKALDAARAAVREAFCPTGDGGGIDNSCGSEGDPSYVPHPYARKDETTILVDPAKLDQAWRASNPEEAGSGTYIPKGGGGAEIEGRRAGFERFLQTGKPVEASRVVFDRAGMVDFVDGRHRFSVLRDRGAKLVAITLAKKDVQRAMSLFGGKPL